MSTCISGTLTSKVYPMSVVPNINPPHPPLAKGGELGVTWLLELGLLILIARSGSEIFRRFRINPLVGEILTGILLAVALGFMHLRFDSHVLEIFSELGILFMLSLIGLET